MFTSQLSRPFKASTTRRTLVGAGAALALHMASGALSPAFAQDAFPNKPIRIVVPFGPATGLDVTIRGLANQLRQQIGVSVVVENREGAGGAIGAAHVQSQPADGYTLVYTANPPFLTQPMLMKAANYDPINGLVPVAKVATIPMALVAAPTAPFDNVDQYVDYARKNPTKVNYAAPGAGTLSVLDMERINMALNLKTTGVPYKSASQALTDIVGSQVHVFIPSFPAAAPFAKENKVKLLAVGSGKRLEQFPNVPTFEEAFKLPGFRSMVWYGLFAPKGTKPEVVTYLQNEVAKALAARPVIELFERNSATANFLSSEDFRKELVRDDEESRKLINLLGLKPE